MAAQIYTSHPSGPSPRNGNNNPEKPLSSIHHIRSSPSSISIANTATTTPPPYSSSSTSIADTTTTAPPPYSSSSSSAAPFFPTISLQIETSGKPLISLPLPLRPDPIPIFSSTSSDTTIPRYISLRPTRSSGSCYLVSPSVSDEKPLSTTTYRFGPGRPPIVHLYLPGCGPASPTFPPGESGTDFSIYDKFPITSISLLTRAVTFHTRWGTFTWRYASRSERHSFSLQVPSSTNNPTALASPDQKPPNSLLILEKTTLVSPSYSPKPMAVKTPVAQLIRDEDTRSVGSKASSAGNGGRLIIDMRVLDEGRDRDEKDSTHGGNENEMGMVMVVTTALVMLKREVDRRRAQQIAILSGVGTGGS